MYLTQDVIRDDFATLVKQLKISQILQMKPEMVMKPQAISKQLQYMPSLHHPLDEGVRVRLVEAKKDDHRNYWFNLIGNTYRLYPDSYSVEGMGIVDSWSGCHTMNNDNNGLVFEVISLPINTMR
jgi:hypothetical protein